MESAQQFLDLISLLELEVSAMSGGHYIHNRTYRQLNRRGSIWMGQTIDHQQVCFIPSHTFYDVLIQTKRRIKFPLFSNN